MSWRLGIALACLLGLSACGVGSTVGGLVGTGVGAAVDVVL